MKLWLCFLCYVCAQVFYIYYKSQHTEDFHSEQYSGIINYPIKPLKDYFEPINSFTLEKFTPNSKANHYSQRIQDVYPKQFVGLNYPISVHKDYFTPIHGYSIDKFSNTNRNHYWHKRSSVDYIVLHYTQGNFRDTVLTFTTNDKSGVSSHYAIAKPTEVDRERQTLQVVPENYVAFHAGQAMWGKSRAINSKSVGIEIINDGYDERSETWAPFYKSQIDIVGSMVSRLVKQYNVDPNNVIGHSDVAPERKIDPGVMFPWAKLYKDYGVGAWLDEKELNENYIMTKYKPNRPCPRVLSQKVFINYLNTYGYNTANGNRAIMAFKAHFTANQKPRLYTSRITETDMYWIWALVAKYIHHDKSDKDRKNR